MRILHITRDLLPRSNGGISTAVAGMMRASVRAGAVCAAISFDAWRPRARAGVRDRRAQPMSSGEPSLGPGEAQDGAICRLSMPDELPRAHEFADRFAPTLLHVHHSMLWPFARELRARLGGPAIAQMHVVQAEQNRLRGLSRATLSLSAQIEALTQADRVIAPSPAAARALQRGHADLARAIDVVPLGIDDGQMARTHAARARADGPVLYAGRFADINGTAELLAAIPRVLERRPETRFIIAGGLPDNAKAERRWRRRFDDALAEPMRARVRLIGWQDAAQLALLYGRAAVLVSPSWFETFGLVVLEAMLHGVAVVATRSGGVEELIEHQRTGLLSPPRDIDGLVEHIVTLLEQPERARALGRAGAAEIRRRHLWQHVVPTLHHLYERAADAIA